ncbi:hypothetical protein N1851_002287 [Merluccius polli]|uniref:Uncharacterized protein n=1 Tax=Merluccius polli TaxID=89951 RepID=A0AA47NAC4_MERPO|nr:hypothetical protein N1851_002287 [Merluccius polli]
MVEEYKATKTHQAMMVQDSQYGQYARQTLRLEQVASGHPAEHADIVRSVAQGRSCLGCSARASWVKANPKEKRGMVQREVHKAEEERRRVKAVAMNKQGSWTRWESVRERALTWQDIWSMEGHRIKFLLCRV